MTRQCIALTSKLGCMPSPQFEFLNDSFLFDPTLIAEGFASVAGSELSRELERYRAYALLKLQVMTDGLRDGGSLRLFAGADTSSLVLLRQAAFYLDRVVLPDPLFPHTEVIGGLRRSLAEGAGIPFSKDLNRSAIAASARLMRDARPMVAAGLAAFFGAAFFAAFFGAAFFGAAFLAAAFLAVEGFAGGGGDDNAVDALVKQMPGQSLCAGEIYSAIGKRGNQRHPDSIKRSHDESPKSISKVRHHLLGVGQETMDVWTGKDLLTFRWLPGQRTASR